MVEALAVIVQGVVAAMPSVYRGCRYLNICSNAAVCPYGGLYHLARYISLRHAIVCGCCGKDISFVAVSHSPLYIGYGSDRRSIVFGREHRAFALIHSYVIYEKVVGVYFEVVA